MLWKNVEERSGGAEVGKNRNKAVGISMMVGLFLIGLCFYLIFITTVLFFFGVSISVFHLPLAVLFSAGTCYLLSNRSKRETLVAVAIGMLVVFTAVFLNRNVADVSWDGNAYHKPMAALLRYGWNPLRETFYNFADNHFPFLSPYRAIFLDAYPKGSEIIAACFYCVTRSLEASKVFNLLSLAGVLCVCAAYLEKVICLKIWQAWICATVFTVHPISITQIFSYYNDGFLWQMILLCTVACLYLLFAEEDVRNKFVYKRISLFFIFGSINIGFNIKFSGVIFFAILCAGIFALWAMRLLRHQRTRQSLRKVLSGVAFYGVTVLSGLAVSGSTAYVMNLFRHGNPLYSVLGAGKQDLIEPLIPMEYKNYSQFGRVWMAFFLNATKFSKDKLPFLFSSAPVSTYDQIIGGWGILFGELLVLGLVILAVVWWKNRKSNPLGCSVMGLLAFLGIFMTSVVPGIWCPRYFVAPLFVPAFALVMLFRYSNETKRVAVPFVAGCLAYLCLMNVSPALTRNMTYFYGSQTARDEWKRIQAISTHEPIRVAFSGPSFDFNFVGLYFDVMDNNIVNYTYAPVYEEGMLPVNYAGVTVYYSKPACGVWAATDLVSFVQAAKEMDGVALLISVKDEATRGLTDEMIYALQSLGLRFDIKDQFRGSYLAVVNQGVVQYEESAMSQITYNEQIQKHKISLTSGGYDCGSIASVKIDGEENAVNSRGINIVLLDVETGAVLDSVAFDTYETGLGTRK